MFERVDEAIAQEKQIKGGSRARKIALIEATNPDWKDLYKRLTQRRGWIALPSDGQAPVPVQRQRQR